MYKFKVVNSERCRGWQKEISEIILKNEKNACRVAIGIPNPV